MLEASTYYVNAGGRGTRLSEVIEPDPELGVAKALLGHEGHLPLVDYHVQRSLALGYGSTVVNAGDQHGVAEYVRDHYGSNHKVSVVTNTFRAGAGHDLLSTYVASPELFGEFTTLSNVDTVLDVNDEAVVASALALEAMAMLVVTTQSGVPNEGAFVVGQDGKVVISHEFPHVQEVILDDGTTSRFSSCGQIVVNKGCLDWLSSTHVLGEEPSDEVSIYKHLLPRIHGRGGLYVFDNGGRMFIDVGTPDDYAKFLAMPPVTMPIMEGVA